jgi:hypothetical protein
VEKRPTAWERSACAGRARVVVTAHSRALAGGSVAAGRWQGAASELTGGHREGAGQGGQGQSSPEQRCGLNVVEDALSGGVQWRGGSSGGRW